jgi:hypothetical protein
MSDNVISLNNVIPFKKTGSKKTYQEAVDEMKAKAENASATNMPIITTHKNQNQVEAPLTMEQIKKTTIEMVMDNNLSSLFFSLLGSGYDFSDPKFQTDVKIIVESVRSALYKYNGYFHPMHQIINDKNVNLFDVKK